MRPMSFKEREIFAGITIPKEYDFAAVRCDGRGFHRLAEELGLARPHDERFARVMVEAAATVVRGSGLNIALAFVFSDEANFIIRRPFPFGGRVEKLDSLIASSLSSAFSLLMRSRLGHEIPAAFDARVVPLTRAEVAEYLAWRQAEAWRNFLNAVAYNLLLADGLAPSEAARRLRGLKAKELIELMRSHGVRPEGLPAWRKRGVLLRYELVRREGFDPIRRRRVVTVRRYLVVDWEPPRFDTPEGRRLIDEAIGAALARI